MEKGLPATSGLGPSSTAVPSHPRGDKKNKIVLFFPTWEKEHPPLGCPRQGSRGPHPPFFTPCAWPIWPQLCVEMLRAGRGIFGEPSRVGVPAGE